MFFTCISAHTHLKYSKKINNYDKQYTSFKTQVIFSYLRLRLPATRRSFAHLIIIWFSQL